MTHVLVIPWSYPRPGDPLAGVFFREQAQALHRRGLQVGVAYPDARSLAEEGRMDLGRHLFRVRKHDDDGVATYRSTFPAIPKAPRARSKVWLWQLNRLIGRYLADHGPPDVVHAHGLLWAGVGAVRARFPREVPVVITAHSSAFARDLLLPWEQAAVAEALGGADVVLAVSRALREQLSTYVPRVRVDVVPNMVDTNFFSVADRSQRADFIWFTAASLTENKGIDALLDAFAGAFPMSDPVRLRIAGAGPESHRLNKLVSSLNLGDRVEFLGRLTRAEVRRELHRADAFVLPSRVETFGVVLIEAMATGLPVVATQSGGPEDFVYPDVGHLVASGDPAALAAAMVDVYEDRQTWRERAPSIRSYVDERYSERAVTDLIINTYQRLIEAGR